MKVWAADANYPAGAFPWSATPTKVAPDDAEITAGNTPTIPPDAQVDNWWRNRVDSIIDATGNTAVVLADGNNNNVDLTGTGSLVGATYFNVKHTKIANFATITGIAAGTDGEEIVLYSEGSADPWFIDVQNVGSTAANRIAGAFAGAIYMPPGAAMRLRYIGGLVNRWTIMATAFASRLEVLHLAGSSGIDRLGVFTRGATGWQLTANVIGDIEFYIEHDTGTKFFGAVVQLSKNSSAAQTISTHVSTFTPSTNTINAGADYTDASAAPGYVELAIPEVVTMAEGRHLYITVKTLNAAGGANDFLWGVLVQMLRPIL